MTIYQTNVFICDECGRIDSGTDTVEDGESVIVTPPVPGWEISYADENVLLCPDCVLKAREEDDAP